MLFYNIIFMTFRMALLLIIEALIYVQVHIFTFITHNSCDKKSQLLVDKKSKSLIDSNGKFCSPNKL